MVSISKADYKLAKQLGFIPKNNVSHSVHNRHYYLSDFDYERLLKTFSQHIKK